MRLLFATTTPLHRHEAPAYHVLSLCGELARHGAEVTLLHRKDPRGLVLPGNVAGLELCGVPWVPVRGWGRAFLRLFARRLRRLQASGKFDWLYLRLGPDRPILEALEHSPIPVAYEVLGLDYLEDSCLQAAARRFALILTDNQEKVRRIRDRWGLAEQSFALKPACAILPESIPEFATPGIRQRYGLSDREFVILHSSSFRFHHDFDTILAAVGKLSFPAALVFCGDGLRRPEIRAKARRLPLRALFPGALPHRELMQLTMAADACVNALTPAAQATGNLRAFKVFEYAACGVPVVETYDPRCSLEGWVSRCLALARCGDPEGMAAHFRDIHASPDRWRHRAAEARQRVLINRTWRTVAAQLLEALEAKAACPDHRTQPCG